ncbi:hypothetical protein KM043_018573 [Ampulex compressa]|nr:hypothetical protein KM043_018573 [Ampulex compressa]
MLKAEIVLWLLASIYGLEIANTVEIYLNLEPKDFDVRRTLKNTKKVVGNFIYNSTINMEDADLYLSFMREGVSNDIQIKLTKELSTIRHAVNIAQKKGKHAISPLHQGYLHVPTKAWINIEDGWFLIAVIFVCNRGPSDADPPRGTKIDKTRR